MNSKEIASFTAHKPTDGIPEHVMDGSLIPLKRHPYSALFETYDLVGMDRQDMDDSMMKVGAIHPVVMYEGQVLDGWNVYQSGMATASSLTIVELDAGVDPWEYKRTSEFCRRHLTPAQKVAILAAKKELESKEGASGAGCSKLNTPSVREIAKELDVSIGTAHKAATVIRDGDPKVIQAMAEGSISLEAAAAVAKLPVSDRPAALITLKDPELVKAASQKRKSSAALRNTQKGEKGVKAKVSSIQASADSPEAEIQRLKVTIKEREEEIQELAEALEQEQEITRSLKARCSELEMKNAKLESKANPPCRETIAPDHVESLAVSGESSTVGCCVGHQVVEATKRASDLESGVGGLEEILAPETGLGLVNAQGEEAVKASAALDETPMILDVMDNVALGVGVEVHSAVDGPLSDADQAVTQIDLPSPLAVHTQALLKVCPPSQKNPDQPDKRTKAYRFYGDAEHFLEIEGGLQRGNNVPDDDIAAYYAYLETHGLAAAAAIPRVVIHEQPSTLVMLPEAEDVLSQPPKEVVLLKTADSTVITPLALVTTAFQAPGLGSQVTESEEILDS